MADGADDTLTLALEGDVSLDAFATATAHFRGLVTALTEELSVRGVRWVIEDLAAGSAITTVRGIAEREDARVGIGAVSRAYLEVGWALERHQPVPYSARVEREARAIAGVLSSVEGIRFETAADEAVLSNGSLVEDLDRRAVVLGKGPTRRRALGAVRGRIQTLSSRGRLRFTLYDALNNRAVSCYLSEGQEEMMRDAWDQVAVVEGLVTRDVGGRPLSVREVSAISVLAETAADAYLQAKGAVTPTDPRRPEDVIRHLRDAG